MRGKGSLYDVEIGLRAAAHVGQTRLRQALQRPSGPVDLFLCLVDHFEPQVGRPPADVAQERLDDWLVRYPQVSGQHRDWDGRHPAHSFFYPWDEYEAGEFPRLAELCAAGWGEVEIHLHHENDTDATLREKFRAAIDMFRGFGALSQWPDGRPAWGFIHGNWALDNSRVENGRNFCGVNNELTVLLEEGCYADFTFPAWQHVAQPRLTNAIYYATDDPHLPKSYESGIPARVGKADPEGLLLIQGPLVPYLERGGRVRRPAIDDGDLASYRRYRPRRLDRWIAAGIQVRGRPDRIFIKLHCHGAADANRHALLGEDLERMFADAETRYNDGQRYRLHYVTAREMFNIVKATEANVALDIPAARDYILKPPGRAVAVPTGYDPGHPSATR